MNGTQTLGSYTGKMELIQEMLTEVRSRDPEAARIEVVEVFLDFGSGPGAPTVIPIPLQMQYGL